MRVNCLLVASLVAGVVALGVGGVFLLVPFGYDPPDVEWGSLVLYALIGVPGRRLASVSHGAFIGAVPWFGA